MSRARRYVIPEMGSTGAVLPQVPNSEVVSGPDPMQSPNPSYQSPTPFSDPISPWDNQQLLHPNSSYPPYFRMSSSIFPSTPECYSQCKIPFGIAISPAEVGNVPVIDYYASSEVPRCTGCNGYMCPQCKVLQVGMQNAWTCALCGKSNPLNVGGYSKVSPSSLIELSNPVYDVIAPKSYVYMNARPLYTFIIDMSYPAFEIGMTQQFLLSLKASIESMSDNSRVCIITMSNIVTVFDIVDKREMVITDLNDASLIPNKENMAPQLIDHKYDIIEILDFLLQRAPNGNGHCLLNALRIANTIMSGIGGIVLVGFANIPTIGVGALKPRSDPDEINLLMLPNDGSGKPYRDISFILNRSSISVHLFCASTSFCDLSTIGVPTGLTCGSCHFYHGFDEIQRAKLHTELFSTLTDSYFWDTSMRLRFSNGIKLIRAHTNCVVKAENILNFPVLGYHDSVVFEVAVEKPVLGTDAIFQISMVYTNSNLERMIRVFTFLCPLTPNPKVIYDAIDEGALIALFTRRAVTSILSKGPIEAASLIRKELSQMFSLGYHFKSMIHLAHALLSNLILRAQHPLGVDGRLSTILNIRSMSLIDLLIYLYPRMFAIDNSELPLPLCASSFSQGSCFLFHTLDRIYIWVSQGATPQYLSETFGVSSIDQLPNEVPTLNTEENQKLQKLINDCWNLSGRFLQTEIIGQGSPRESVFSEILIDDSRACGATLNELRKEFSFSAQGFS